MKERYYKLPLDFGSLVNQNELDRISLEGSVSQHILLLVTTRFGECKFDENLGTRLWDEDFSVDNTSYYLKKMITDDLKNIIQVREKRLILEDIAVNIQDSNVGNINQRRVKTKIQIIIHGNLYETNKPFIFQDYFFIGPLSYL